MAVSLHLDTTSGFASFITGDSTSGSYSATSYHPYTLGAILYYMQTFLLIFLIFFQSNWEVATQIHPIILKDNLQLRNYVVSKSQRLNENEYILIAKDSIQNNENEGHRLIYLSKNIPSKRFLIKFISTPKGETYVYNPYFFEFADGGKIIIAEQGLEYMSGIDIYRLRDSRIDFLGYVPVSGPNRDSVIEQLKIEKLSNEYKLSFSGRIEYKIATDNIIEGSHLSVLIINDELYVKLE